MLCGIISIPSNIINDAEIFVNFDEEIAKSYLSLLNFETNRVHQLGNDLIYAHDLYIAVGEFGINCLHLSWKELHQRIYKLNNLEKIVPNKHVFINKEYNNWGAVDNFDEMYSYAKNQFPQYEFRRIRDDYVLNVNKTAKLYASIKVLVTASGSLAFNDLFLHEGCGVLLLSKGQCDTPAISTGIHLGLWVYALSSNKKYSIRDGVPLERFQAAFHDIMHAVYNKSWPKDIRSRTRPFISNNIDLDIIRKMEKYKLEDSLTPRYLNYGDKSFKIMKFAQI
ncbi:hypothetical protein TVAG_381990 [Trichomonas vaginalis G3]|uniref:Glycosyltransferase 61 catalytic domain-containing protein n=1 Tax=Trichomonas vaginalis (strain ATCC PRA-98 / G3) TaxID=412133 RepID=A2F2A2_TRIV3|nr:hypothetical protein TVAGG3_0496790 [Trichomonas vaginalis G3]EAY00981.1 hypothetical protein TVAG_381990 [Trichomonas vaginalis G3]KAI5516787.1 hypothetical protein TVAGG3_0496790 [Trichomonas vaginalis G3]|eukprot:XP_001330052.1 hypothetical protein [Trichomonas vaginalis G3]